MKKGCLVTLVVLVVLIVIGIMIASWVAKNYNLIVEKEEEVNKAWSQVENVYQRRYDLIPNLVQTVKGYAKHENEVLVGVTEARAKMGGMVNLGPEILNNPQKLAEFQQMQGSLTSALQRLMVVVEQYPQLKADKNFLELQAQLEGTENRIAVERRRFNETVQEYNTFIRKFPAAFIASLTGFHPKAYFQADSEAQKAPKVEF